MSKKIVRRRRRIDPLEEAANVFAERLADAVDIVMDRVIQNVFPGRLPNQSPPRQSQGSARPRRQNAPGPTLYDDLEVSPHASQETITAAWKSLCRRYHPDTNKSTSATERIKQINAAYSVLGNPEKRKMYDRNLK